jgi:pilus assembly protein CpaC
MSPVRATAIFVAVSATVGTLQAQSLQPSAARVSDAVVAAAPVASETEVNTSEVALLVGRSTLLTVGQPITRVSLTSPDVADAMVTSPGQLLIHGKAPGTISMFVWDRAGGIKRYEVVVRRDLSELLQQVKQLFPGEPITVHSNGKDVIISGTVSSKYVIDKAAEVAAGYVEKKEDVVNLLRQQEGIASNQVLLRVRFAEVSRSAMSELGASLFADGFKDKFGRTTTQQFAAPFFDQQAPMLGKSLVFSDYLNLFLFDAKNGLGGVIRALSNKGLFQSLAEPNLIAENGKEASFLAGGEYPYPVIQGTAGGQSVTIQFKEFGVKLNFTPTIVGGDLVKLKVRPEVSSLDFSNAIVLEGFRVPAISTRRTETEVELQDGQTFAIAGLMNNTVTSQMQKIPGIGDIPILGYLFRSKAAQKNQTELVVMITPTILRRGSTGVSPKLPDIVEPYLPPAKKSLPSPEPWNPGAPSGQAQAPAPQAQPAAQPATPRVTAPVVAQQQMEGAASAAPASPAKPQSPAQTKAQREAAEKAEKQAREQAAKDMELARKREAEARKVAAENAKVEARKADEDRKRADKAAREQAKEQARVQAELDRRMAEAARRQAEADKKNAVKDAERQAKLDAARREYEQQVAKIQAENQQSPR